MDNLNIKRISNCNRLTPKMIVYYFSITFPIMTKKQVYSKQQSLFHMTSYDSFETFLTPCLT